MFVGGMEQELIKICHVNILFIKLLHCKISDFYKNKVFAAGKTIINIRIEV